MGKKVEKQEPKVKN